MPRKYSKVLIIDADVAGACGGSRAKDQTTPQCRKFLAEVMSICHRVAMNKALLTEWKKHETSFAEDWRVEMFRKGKLSITETREDESLREYINSLNELPPKHINDMLKDCHLIELGFQHEMRVISLDSVRGLFAAICKGHTKLSAIVWVNPSKPDEQPIEWLASGAKIESSRTLAKYKIAK